jgi:RNA polymerase sigma-70 factor (ECF subfamily)
MDAKDLSLFERMKEGDEHALRELIWKYTDALYRFASRFSFSPDEAEDILQLVFIKIWNMRTKYDQEKSSPRTWIYTITRSVIYDALRKKKREGEHSVVSPDFDFQEIEDSGVTALEEVLRGENKKILSEAMNILSADQKTVLSLYYEEDISLKEISEILGKPHDTVKSHHLRALAKLRAHFAREGAPEVNLDAY